jgi:hypothetical protein
MSEKDSKIPEARPNELVVGTDGGRVLVRIGPDGTLTYGDDYTPDEAAKAFWEAMARRRVDYEQRLVFLAQIENLMARVGEQDLVTETARLKAAGPGGTPQDAFGADMAMAQLNTLVHELLEFARGIAYRNRHNREEVPNPPMPADKRFMN